jgi:carbon-monoxide dehydrogenase medium subunit
MKAPPFAYLRANTLTEAFRLWQEAGAEAKLLAGGQSLLAALAFRLSEPSALIDISRLRELKGIAIDGRVLRVGALTTHRELGSDPAVTEHLPLLAAAVPLIAHPAVRNRGTLGGSLAYADPAAELPACCVALDATIIANSSAGERRIPANTFFRGLYATALQANELIAAVEFPLPEANEKSSILELARRAGDYAMAGIVLRVRFNGAQLTDPMIVLFGVGDGPVIAKRAMAALTGSVGDGMSLAAAQAALDADLNPPADLNGGADMKRQLARVLLARALNGLQPINKVHAA